jgi:para-aminobenzoate synthetase/4-amino-4-deoxychorismate lyase
MFQPFIILDDAAHGRIQAFSHPKGIIRADTPEDVAAALTALELAQQMGFYAVGYISYEAGYALEPKLSPLMPPHRNVPLLWFGVFDEPERIDPAKLDDAFDGWCSGRAYAGALHYEWSAAAYRERFDRIKELIAAGDFYEANLSFRAAFSFVGDPLTLYRSLRRLSAAPYGAYIDDGERRILSLSPELFFEISQGMITARPMKGTAARKAGREADEAARTALAASVKDRAENLMIVDLLRNDIGRIAQIGSVAVSDLFSVETYPTVHQMVSTVSGQLLSGVSFKDVVEALFPCGSITGAPKIRAMEALREEEGRPRGIYCGAVGLLRPDGGARFNVAIRTVTLTGNRGLLGIGGAVVQDSTAEGEYAECLIKARYMATARLPLELIETLRFSPGKGFVRGDLHLARMKRAAEFFAISFDEAGARAAMAKAVAGSEGDLRARLTLDETGRFACLAWPAPPPVKVWTYAISPRRVSSRDVFAPHKTNQREFYEKEYVRIAKLAGCDEVVFLNEKGEVAEGSRSTVFVARDGKLLTPPLACGVLDGCLRRELIETGRAEEAVLKPEDLSGEVYLGNSLRGLIAAVSIV